MRPADLSESQDELADEGLPLTESEKSVSHSVMSDSLRPYGLSMEFSRQEYWSGLPLPSPRNLPDPGIKPRSPALQADSLLSEVPGKPHLFTSSCCFFQHYETYWNK